MRLGLFVPHARLTPRSANPLSLSTGMSLSAAPLNVECKAERMVRPAPRREGSMDDWKKRTNGEQGGLAMFGEISEEEEEKPKPKSKTTKKSKEEEKPKSKTTKKIKEEEEEEEEEEEKPKSKTTKKSNEVKGDGQCQYVYTRKPKTGERCSVKVKNGGCYCSTHKAYENKSPKEKAVIPKVSKSQKESPQKESPRKESPKKEVIRKPTFRINNDIKKHVHPETNLVLKSASDKKIIGKLEDKKIIDLNEEDVETCKKWGFAIDEEQLKKLNNNEEEEEEEEKNIVEHYLIKESWSTDEEYINGKIKKEKLESLIKKKVIKGEYDEEYESEGYPISLDIDKKNKKIILKYTDGKGKENNINITSSSDENLSKLFDYINDLKSDSKNEDKKQDDNLSKKSPKKEVKEHEDDIEDIENILDEVEEEDDDDEELLEDDE
jgi:hypothetical protein